MASHQTDILISLNNADKDYLRNTKELHSLEKNCVEAEKIVQQKNTQIAEFEAKLAQAKKSRSAEQEKLDQEQLKISERRKQLTSLGGAKSAKLVEREMGIAKKTVEALEQNVFNAIQIEEDTEKKLLSLQAEATAGDEKLEKAKSALSDRGNNLKSEIQTLLAQKAELIKKLDERTALLYKRVESRHKGDAIAFAEAGACKSCFRALPAQTFNQIMAGYNLIQCPGCSRLLVHAPTIDAGKSDTVVNQ